MWDVAARSGSRRPSPAAPPSSAQSAERHDLNLWLDLAQADVDAHAELVMRRVARTFDLAARLLPGDVRRDVRRLYLVLRTLDDLVDTGDLRAPTAIAEVEAWADRLPPAGPGAARSLVAILDDLAARHPRFPLDAMADFCAGMRADLAGPDHRSEADLSRYCYQVAGTVGRMMASLLGVAPGHEREADAAARALGMAMQRTNILRDLAEDARRGRVYLPDDAFDAVGLEAEHGRRLLTDLPAWPADTRAAFVQRQIERAEDDYAQGLDGIRHLVTGRRSIRAAGLMYREILRQIEREDFGGRRPRVVVSRGRKLLLVARASVLAR
ncbi:MAG: phytoene/squalene synthase family protein [Chloroflexota bacterium]